MNKRAVIHFLSDLGEFVAYVDDGVEVIVVSDAAPSDRLYRMTTRPIPPGLLDGEIGHEGDGKLHPAKAERILRALDGRSPFDVIDGGE